MEWNIEKLIEDLEKKYGEKEGGQKNWLEEKVNVLVQLQALNESLSNRYINEKILDRGGTGILLLVEDRHLHNQQRVIKFPRPLKDNAEDFFEMLNKEVKLLSRIRNKSIVTIHEAGEIDLIDKEIAGLKLIPFYVMDFVKGSESDKFIEHNKIDSNQFIDMIQNLINAIKCLHDNNLIHLDIKSQNILINSDGDPVIIDLGTTKQFNENDNQYTKIGTTWPNACQELKRYIHLNKDDPDRSEGEIKRNEIKFTWDLETLSKMLFRWIEIFLLNNEMSVYKRKYLRLMALRLKQDPYTTDDIKIYGLEKNFLEYLRYKNIGKAFIDVKKITLNNTLSNNLIEFDDNYHQTIQIGTHKNTTLSERLAKTMDHPVLRRLAEISQLGIVKLIYPTATHTRLEHSIGTYHNVIMYIRSLYNDPLNPLFRQMIEEKDIKAALLAALLHDVGQFPLAHDFEDIDGSLFDHSSLVRDIIKGQRDTKLRDSKKMEFPSLKPIFDLWGLEKEDVLNILEAKINSTEYDIKCRILKSLISGPLDADKLDYLLRDSKRLNVTYPQGIDTERLLKCLTLIVKDHANGVLSFVSIHEKGKVPAEFLTLSRYAMFSQVYWHHSVRSIKAMLARPMCALLEKLEEEKKKYAFKHEFEWFVLFGIDKESLSKPIQQELFPEHERNKKDVYKNELDYFSRIFSGAILNSWDLATLKFVYNYMVNEKVYESELVRDIINRKLYKRLFIFDHEHDNKVWNGFIKYWDELTPCEQNRKIISLERELIKAYETKFKHNKIENENDSIYLTEENKENLKFRLESGLPIILIDIPKNKPGSKLSMEYVLEEDRRSLRKSNRICGNSQPDILWEEYAEKLREKAGRIRVFAHPEYVDTILSVVDKSWMGQILQDLSAI